MFGLHIVASSRAGITGEHWWSQISATLKCLAYPVHVKCLFIKSMHGLLKLCQQSYGRDCELIIWFELVNMKCDHSFAYSFSQCFVVFSSLPWFGYRNLIVLQLLHCVFFSLRKLDHAIY